MFRQSADNIAVSHAVATNDENTSTSEKSEKYQALPGDLGTKLYALFTTYHGLDYFTPHTYSVVQQDGELKDLRLNDYILVRKTDSKATKYDLLSDIMVGGGTGSQILVINATLKLNQEIQTAVVKFGHYVVKVSEYTLEKKEASLASAQRERAYTRLVTPSLKMKEPVLVDSGRAKDPGYLFLVMKEQIGMDLHELIDMQYPIQPVKPPDAGEKEKGKEKAEEPSAQPRFKLTTRGILTLMVNVAEIIVDLHESKKIIHRDLKPANIWVNPDLSVKLIDLAFAKNRDEKDDRLCGSLSYMDPDFLKRFLAHEFENYHLWATEERENIFTEKSEAWTFGLIIGELLNIAEPAKKLQGLGQAASALARNEKLRLDSRNAQLNDVTPLEMYQLIELANDLLHPIPAGREDLKTTLPILKEILAPILARLDNQPLYEGIFPVREQKQPEVKLAELNNLLLFKNAQSTTSSPAHTSKPELYSSDEESEDADSLKRTDEFVQTSSSNEEGHSKENISFERDVPSSSSEEENAATRFEKNSAPSNRPLRVSSTSNILFAQKKVSSSFEEKEASCSFEQEEPSDASFGDSFDSIEHIERQCAEHAAQQKQWAQVGSETPRPGRRNYPN